MKNFKCIFIFFIFYLSVQPSGWTAANKRVLILNSYHSGYSWSDNITQSAINFLHKRFESIEIYVEYMDTKRLYSKKSLDLLKQTLILKYKNIKLDIIISADDNALTFLMGNKNELFGDVPVVFCGINNLNRPQELKNNPDYTGIIEVLEIKPTLDIALKLCPDIKKIMVISDSTPTAMGFRKDMRKIQKKYSDIEFIYLNGEDLTTEELISTLKNLKQGTIVLCFVWFRDKTGRYFSLEHMGSKIIGSCAVPFFPLNYFWMKYGAVGGKLNSGISHGTKAADIASKIMLGTHKPKDFPIQQCRNKYIFDYNQLRKWNFNMSLLPEGSIIINRHLSFFQRHKIFTISILLFVILQTLVIIAFISNLIMRKKAEHEKTSSQKRCRNLIETINDWVWETNSDLKYTFSSSTVEQILGYAPEEIIGKTPLDIIVPEEHDRISAFLNKTIKEKKPFNMLESTNFHKDGHKVILERSGVPIFNEKNKFIGFRGIDRDISYKKKIEKEREYLLYDLSIKNEDLENIVYIASHDLRSPLVNIQGFSNELCEIFTECFGKINQMDISITQKQEITKNFETFVKPSFEFIRKNILKMDKLLASLLKLAKIGNAAMEITAINMNELMDSIFSAMQYQIKTAKLKIEKNSLPDCMGDCIQINQIFSNLIDNAIKYTDPNKQGKIIVTAKKNNSKIIYCIKDNGIGIDPLYHLKVFDIFQRLNPNNQIDGIGIGLTIVKRIVERNNGKIWIDSKAGQGCKVFVELPSAS